MGCRNGAQMLSRLEVVYKALLLTHTVGISQLTGFLGFSEGPSNPVPAPLMHSNKSIGTDSQVPFVNLGLAFLSVFVLSLFIPYLHIWFPPVSKAREEEVRKKFRPIEQLKEEFEKLNMKIETDYEIMVKLISKFNSSASTLDEKVAALYDLEYYVHQVTRMPQ